MMKLSQSRVVPLAIFTAITAAVMAILLFQGQLVFGQEDPVVCIPNSSASIIVTDASAEDANADVANVSNGMRVAFQTILSVGELPEGDVACTFEGGDLTITTPDGGSQELAGGSTGIAIPLVQVGSVYSAPVVEYTVNQADAVNGVLVVNVSYTNGVAHSTPETVARATGENKFAMAAPSITVEVDPADQTIFEGGDAEFTITVRNTGGFMLSNVVVSDSLDTTCDESLATLEVGGGHSFECKMSPAQEADNVITATADVTGGAPEGQESVTANVTASIGVEPVTIEVTISPASQTMRIGETAEFDITVTNPNSTDIVEVGVTVDNVEGCNQTIAAMGPAGSGTAVETYRCSSTLGIGTTMVTATATGTVSEVGTEVSDSAQAEVVVFDAVLGIEISPRETTIREDQTVAFTVTVSNNGDADLTDVGVAAPEVATACTQTLGTLAAGQTVTNQCTSGAFVENAAITMTVSGTAPDGNPVSGQDTMNVRVIHPNSAVVVSAIESMRFQIVVHVLRITETNTGDSPLTDVFVDVDSSGSKIATLTKDSTNQWIGGDAGDDGVLSPGETWEWRVVTVTLQGPGVVLGVDAETAGFTATGHGTDPLGGAITHPAYADELDTLEVSVS